MKTKAIVRIFANVIEMRGVTTPGLVASDLKLGMGTVKRHLATLTDLGLVQQTWDGVGVEASDQARKDLALGLPLTQILGVV